VKAVADCAACHPGAATGDFDEHASGIPRRTRNTLMPNDSIQSTVLVWDLPLRVFHWLLAISFAGAFLTAESERWRDVHAVLGYTVLALVAFRILWGVFGTRYARFGALPLAPRRALAYLRSLVSGRPEHHLGHNPAGSLAIYALLILAGGTAFTGLASLADIGGEWLEELHEGIANTMLAVGIVHIAGVVVGSLAQRENLTVAMLTGRKRGALGAGISEPRPLVAATLFAGVVGLWTGIVPTPGLELAQTLISVTSPAHAGAHPVRHDDD
jgi:cytochrome b